MTTEPTKKCCCEEPWTKGVVHRTDGPCYWPPRDTQPPPSSLKENIYDVVKKLNDETAAQLHKQVDAPTPAKEWEEEFHVLKDAIKSFIHSLLQTEREKIAREVEKLRDSGSRDMPPPNEGGYSEQEAHELYEMDERAKIYNTAIDDILTIIRNHVE